MTEMRQMFTHGQLIREGFREFCRERLDIITDKERDTTGIDDSAGLLVVHIAPLSLLSANDEVDIRALYDNHFTNLRPIDSMGPNRRFNFDGMVVYSGGERLTAYTQVFRNGVIESAFGDFLKYNDRYKTNVVPGLYLERVFFETIPLYFQAYADVGVPPPFVVQVTLDGVKDAHYAYQEGFYFGHPIPRLDRDRMFLAECMIESVDGAADIHRALKPAFDSLYNAIDRAECPQFGEDGIWSG